MESVRVLIVEDETIIAMAVRAMLLSMGGFEPILARSGEEAVEKAAAMRPGLLLMDINLGPGMDGIEAARRIKADRDVPVVFVSAFSDENIVRRARTLAPLGYLVKPLEPTQLMALLSGTAG